MPPGRVVRVDHHDEVVAAGVDGRGQPVRIDPPAVLTAQREAVHPASDHPLRDVRVLAVARVGQQHPALRGQPAAERPEDQVRRTGAHRQRLLRQPPGRGDLRRQPLGAGRRRGTGGPVRIVRESRPHSEGRREPGIQHIGHDDVVPPVQGAEVRADRRERGTAVLAAVRPRRERHVQPPVHHGPQPLQRAAVPPRPPRQLGHTAGQHLERHRPAADGAADRAQTDGPVQVEHFGTPHRHHPTAAPGGDPAQRRVHQQGCRRGGAPARLDGEDAHLEHVVAVQRRHLVAGQVLVQPEPPQPGRSEADEADADGSARRDEVDVVAVEAVAQPPGRIRRVLAQLLCVDPVTQFVDPVEILGSGRAQLQVTNHEHLFRRGWVASWKTRVAPARVARRNRPEYMYSSAIAPCVLPRSARSPPAS